MAYKVLVYSFSDSGKYVADRICSISLPSFRCEKILFYKSENSTLEKEKFLAYDAHVFVGASGIAVRKIAPYITDKHTDPAVIVVDEKGQFVIPVLSVHAGGANGLSEILSEEIQGQAVITTATDVNGYNAIDKIAADCRLQIEPEDAARRVNAKILKGEKIKVYVDENIEILQDETGVYELSREDECDVKIINYQEYILGVGCRKNIDTDLFEKTLDDILSEYKIDYSCIDRMASIDLKAEEKALVNYSEKHNIMFETYSAMELESCKGQFDESGFVKEITGVSNVSERACTYAASFMGKGEFILKRKVACGITISLYKVRKRIDLNGKA